MKATATQPELAGPAERLGDVWRRLTPRQQEVVFALDYLARKDGRNPTLQAIADHLGGVSKASVFEHLQAAVAKGALVNSGDGSRAYSVAEPPGRAAALNAIGSLIDRLPAGALLVPDEAMVSVKIPAVLLRKVRGGAK
jgi:SOS-response transcriptional repressor LexA